MPLIDPNLAQTWASAYTGGYSRANTTVFGLVQKDAAMVRQLLNLQPGQKIAAFGAGFGWEVEEWQAAGLGPIIAVDFSTWIQANKTGNATVTILNEDGTTTQSRNRIKSALGVTGNNKCDWAISMDMAPWLTDAEILRYVQPMRDIATRVAHLISCADPAVWEGAPVGNWKTLEQWKVLLNSDTVVERGNDFRVL